MKKALERYTRKRIKRLRQFLRSYLDADNLEILHHVRVEIKKIKMLIGLLHSQNNKLDKRHTFKPFRKVFRLAGEIRDPELHRSLALDLTGESLGDDLNSAENVKRFRKVIPKAIQVIRKRKRQLLKEANAVTTQAYETYLKKKRMNLKAILNGTDAKAELHQARKMIKDIYYLESIVKPKKSIDPFYTDAARIIGDWHDKMMLIEKLYASGKPRKTAIHMLQRQCNVDVKTLKTLIAEFYQ